MEEKVFHFEHWTLQVNNGLLYIILKVEELNIEVAKVCVKQRIDFSNGTSYPCLFDLRQVKNVPKDARDYLADEGNELVTASAILVNSAVLKMAVNFYISVNKPKNPTRLFTSKEAALEWLEQFK